MANKKGAGRPQLPGGIKKKQVNMKLSPWIIKWLDESPQAKAVLVEEAVINHYKLVKPE